jgi:hypothetical protein
MALDAWLPIGFTLPDGAKVRTALFEGTDWQIYETMGGGRALVVLSRWRSIGRMRVWLKMERSTPHSSETASCGQSPARRARHFARSVKEVARQ